MAAVPSAGVQARAAPARQAEWAEVFGQRGTGADIPLGTARWMPPEDAFEKLHYAGSLSTGPVWIGENFDSEASALGYEDDRHVCLVSGSRAGKGAGVIVPNLCCWPGSCIVVDPKGENAAVTARRRGDGSAYTHGMGQKVCILDPFGEVQLPASLKARYNPLDAIDPESDLAVDDAARVAAALVVIENRNEPYWEEAARNLLKGLILHVLSAPDLKPHRNLVTVRRLLTQGDWLSIEKVRAAGDGGPMPSAFEVLWSRMRNNPAFHGVVAGVGEQMIAMADKQLSGVLESARTNTEFLDSMPMRRLLETSDFDLGELKTNGVGLTIYLTLPQRFMETHYRWLRLMTVLAIGEMERIKGRPATGFPTLFLLDEFAGLKRMEVIENAAAQAAGFGVKFLFVVQNLRQLDELYERSWETFLGNSGLKLFFHIEDDFTRSYLSRQLGELETLRQSRSGSESRSDSFSTTTGTSHSDNSNRGITRSPWLNLPKARQRSTGYSTSTSETTSRGQSGSTTDGWSEGVHKRPLLNPDEVGRLLARIDNRGRPGFPGLALALIPGEHPLLARRVNYFESRFFAGYFDPHPNYPPPPTLDERAQMAAQAAPQLSSARSSKPKKAGTALKVWATLGAGAAFLIVCLVIVAAVALSIGGQPNSQSQASQAAPLPSAAYTQGVADWDALQGWMKTLTGATRAGADYWSAHRIVRGHVTCASAARDYTEDEGDRSAFLGGCEQAQRWLTPIDQRRANPDYRSGFNDEAKRVPL